MTITQRAWRDAVLWGVVIVGVCVFIMMGGYVSMLETDGPQSLTPFFKILCVLGAIPLLPGIAIGWVVMKLFHVDSFNIILPVICIVDLLIYIPQSHRVLLRGRYKDA